MVEKIAKKLAEKLIWIYNERKIARYTALNRSHPEGFTWERVRGNPSSLFQMIILAAYDRQPFTRIAKGWEPIWGVASAGPSLPAILRQASLFDLDSVLSLSHKEIERRLTGSPFFGYRLHSDGAWTHYGKTFMDAANQANSGLLNLMESATTADDVNTIHRRLDSIHGIGPTIASKLVMYTLREVGLGSIDPGELYPAVKPILTEYHNARLAQELEDRYQQPNLIEHVFEALKDLGDPFAIDALYYVDRDDPELRKFLTEDVRVPGSFQSSKQTEEQPTIGKRLGLERPRKTQAPPWSESEFETVLNSYGLSDEELARRMPQRTLGAIGVVRSGIHAFHSRGADVAKRQQLLSNMMIYHLERKRGSLVCPACGTKF